MRANVAEAPFMSPYVPAPRRTKIVVPVLTAIVAIAIFVVDTLTPLDIAVAVLYVAVVLLAVDFAGYSGILAIAMAKLWQRPVTGGDNDAEAVEVARENAALNGVPELCSFFVSAGLQADALASRAPYDLIVANILAAPLLDLAESFGTSVRPGGRVLLSGLLVEQAAGIIAGYEGNGFTFERRIDLETGGAWWRSLVLRRS